MNAQEMESRTSTFGNAEFLTRNNARFQWHPMTSPTLMEQHLPTIIVEGKGCYVTDVNGRRYLDSQGSLWNVNVGHGRPEIREAILNQLDKIAYFSTFDGTSNGPSIELSVRLIEMLKQENMSKVFFGSGGSDAIETALKLSRQYWRLKGQPQRFKFISLKNCYHGVHFGGLSINGHPIYKKAYEPLLSGCYQIDCPSIYRNPWTNDAQELGEICASNLERELLHQGPDSVAAFIAEPIQGGGGIIVPPPNFWPLVRKVCDKYEVLMVADEVVTGFGRSGELFGVRNWKTSPDIMCFAKGITSGYIPCGATVINKRVAEAWYESEQDNVIMHGYTYSGHPVACAAALAALDIVEKESLPTNASEQGAYLLEQLRPFAEDFPSVGNVRGKGLMVGLDLVKDKRTKEPVDPFGGFARSVADAAREQNVIVRAVGSLIAISPPLIIEREQIDEIVHALRFAFEKVDKKRA
jgi:adenosylmethionine-8-amino-7-oxononanoate aminotransferase